MCIFLLLDFTKCCRLLHQHFFQNFFYFNLYHKIRLQTLHNLLPVIHIFSSCGPNSLTYWEGCGVRQLNAVTTGPLGKIALRCWFLDQTVQDWEGMLWNIWIRLFDRDLASGVTALVFRRGARREIFPWALWNHPFYRAPGFPCVRCVSVCEWFCRTGDGAEILPSTQVKNTEWKHHKSLMLKC